MSQVPSRADRFNPAQKTPTYYSDFTTDFDLSPFSGDLALLTNDSDINESIKNLVLTQLGERLYDNTIGSAVMTSLFENFSPLSQQFITTSVQNCIKFCEPRANLQGVVVTPYEDQNYYQIDIWYTDVNSTAPVLLSVIVSRVR